MKNERFEMRMKKSEKTLMQRAAKKADKSLATFIRDAAFAKAQSVLGSI